MKNTVQELRELKEKTTAGYILSTPFKELVDLCIGLATEVERLTELSKLPARPDVPPGTGMVIGANGEKFYYMIEEKDNDDNNARY